MTLLRAGARAETEAGLQRAVREALEWHGYVVEETTERRKRCSGCGTVSHRGSGVTRGIPDLLIGRPGTAFRIGLEVKTARGVLSAEQRAAERAGRIVVVRSVEEALRVADRWRHGLEESSR